MNEHEENPTGIAIVGMAGRFPKARSLHEFWNNLCQGVEAVSFFSDAELADATSDAAHTKSNYVKARAILENPELFDAAFFGMNPREAELTDPQHRLFLEAAWEALEDANCDPTRCGEGIGVFAGMSTNTYLANNLGVTPQLLIGINGEFQAMVGNERDYLPTRVSYKLNLRGPSLNVQTACSTSLVAVSMACQHLLTYQCNLALAGAVSVSFPQKRGYVYQEGGITSPDGHCRPFDVNSAGTVAGDGVGVVALKRLEDALRDGDAIYAVIKGFATNNDGALKVGYTAPSIQGQADVIAMAQAMAGFAPETIGYIEAHGTGTPLGDPIEIEGLTRAFRLGTNARNFCAIGSVKGNIGHLDTAAGIAGLIKTALALRHKRIPPSLHFVSPNPKINFEDSPFHVSHELGDWTGAGPRRAGISSFGIGGTNAHVVLEEAPASPDGTPSRNAQLLVVSARTKPALQAAARNLSDFLATHPDANLPDVAFTLQLGRRAFEHKAAVVCRTGTEAVEKLKSLEGDGISTGGAGTESSPVVFMFPGQGAQRVNMGRELYESEPVFKEAVDECCQLLEPHLGQDLRTVLYSDSGNSELTQTAITQPAMFVIEYALAKLWMSWGVQPAAMIGHSLGEYVAACLAGVFSLPDALRLVATRGKMMQALPHGMMLAVRLPEAELRPLLTNSLSIAAVNAPNSCVVSGPTEAVEAFSRQLKEKNVGCVALQTSHAFHSAMMEPMLKAFADLVREIGPQAPNTPFISNVSGTWITAEQATDPAYWATHVRQTVRFADGLNELLKDYRVLLEVGPGEILSGLARQHPARKSATAVVPSLRGPKETSPELDAVLNALGKLWVSGVTPDWEKFYAREKRQRVWLPTYPFERKPFWVAPVHRQLRAAPVDLSADRESSGAHNGHAFERDTRNGSAATVENETLSRVRALVAKLSGLEAENLDPGVAFTQLGFDSLFLTQATVAIERDFGVRVAFRQLLESFPNMNALALHIERSSMIPGLAAQSGNGHIQPEKANSDVAALAPLTESQREIWFASQISEAASCVYNECRLLNLRGPLLQETLQRALQDVTDRHEALRTTFLPGGELQQIHPALEIKVALADWSTLPAPEQEVQIISAQQQEARQPFDLERGPLIRARLISLGKDHHVLILTVHHLVCDGYSFGILLRELGNAYSARRSGGQLDWPSPLQFSEYARLQAERRQSRAHAEDEAYWLDQFKAGAPVLELPTDWPRGSVWRFDGARQGRALPKQLGEKLRRLSAEQGCTLFTTLFAAYNVLLARLSRQKDIAVGVPLADRAMAQGETLVGHCVSFLPLRARVESSEAFTSHLAAMQKVFLSADEHGRYTLGSLLKKLAGSRDPSRMSLVSATFNLDRISQEPAFAGLDTDLADNSQSSASFDLNVDAIETGGGLQINCRYNASLFSAQTIERWLTHFQTLLEGIVTNPQTRVCDLPLLTRSEREQILVQWNDTGAAFPRDTCVHEIFEAVAAQNPQVKAVEFEDGHLTYQELNERANRLAHYLRKNGVGPESIVAICLDRSFDMIVSLLAILKAGGAYLALDPSHPKERLALLLQEAGSRVVLTHSDFRELCAASAPPPACKIVCIDRLGAKLDHQPASNPAAQATADNLAYISFTSGSTGTPKGVCIPHRAIVRLVKNTDYASFDRSEAFLQLAPLAFDASTFEIWGPLLNGARLVIFPPHPPSLSELGKFISDKNITTLWLTSGLFHQMIEKETPSLRGLRQLLAGGDVLSVPHVKRALSELPNCRLINGYGPTENTTFTCCHQIDETSVTGHSIPIGLPISNTQVFVLDEAAQPVPIGVPGELYAGGDGLARGYLNRPEITAEKFVLNPFAEGTRLYRTGDLVRWLPDGTIQFLGRIDEQVKIRGNRVELGEIETALSRHPEVRECVVVARDDGSGDKRLIAYYVTANPNLCGTEALREHLRQTLPDFMVPSAFVRLAALPLTASGKVDRHALPSLNEFESQLRLPYALASDDIEKKLAGIWQEILGRRRVGVTEDFFDLGGHSLLALRLIARVEEVFGRQIPVASVFQARTVAQMASLLRDNAPSPRKTSIVEIQPLGSRPPLMFVHGAGGGMFWGYTALAHHLGTDQPVYGFKCPDPPERDSADIEEIAAHYVADLRRLQPHGPYQLGGYCFGGNVAYEMARQLRAQGETIALLALINCMPPNSSYDRVELNPGFCLRFMRNLLYWGKYVWQLKPGRRRHFLAWKLRAIRSKLVLKTRPSGAAPLNFDIEDFVDLASQPEGKRSLWQAHVHALFKHQHKPYPGPITLLRTRGHTLFCSFDETYGWRDFAEEGVAVHIISGAHETIMDEPHVKALAEELGKCLETARTQFSARPSTVAEKPKAACIHELFEQQAARTPEAAALVLKNERLSYVDLNRRADGLANRLRALGIGHDVPVGICLERSFDMVIGILGILKAGGAYVPLDPTYPAERLKLMVTNTRIPVLLTKTSLRSSMDFGIPELKLVCLDDQTLQPGAQDSSRSTGAPALKQEAARPESLAYIIHTSGSTGVPKGVAIEHRNAVNFIHWAQSVFSPEELAGVLFSTSICFDLSVFELFVTLSSGGKVILARNALELPELPARDEVTLINTVPSAAAELLRLKGIPPNVQVINLAGEPLKTALVDKLYGLGTVKKVYDLYGPSETTTYSTYTLRQAGAPPTVGRAIANTEIYLLDDKKQPVPTGEIGEIYIGGAGVARGYLHRPDLTAERFLPDSFGPDPAARLYKTGDLARWRPDDNLEFLGRIDHQIKIRGFRVELGEIESVLAQHPAVRECAVIAREDTPGEKRLAAYLVKADANVGTDALREFLKIKLPDYMVPSAFVTLESLPLTPNGKLDRKRLPVPDKVQVEQRENFVAPKTSTEEIIAQAWREVLGSPHVGVQDNFFELGGDSLLAVRVVARLREAFQVQVPVSALFDAPTIALLAEGLAAARWGKAVSQEEPIGRAPRTGNIPLSFSQQRLWFIDQLEPGNVGYNMPAAIKLEGALDPAVLRDCLNEVVQRHEILRTTFPSVNGEPEQKINASISLDLPLIDLSDLPAADRESHLQQEILAEARRPFDLATGPLLRAKLLCLDRRVHVLVLVMHHIVSDGWSLDLLLKELAAFWDQKTSGTKNSLSDLPIQYADYAIWQRRTLSDDALKPHLDFWRNILAGAPPSLKLLTDHDASPETAREAARVAITLPKELSPELRKLIHETGGTSFITLLTALIVTLSRWTRQTDVVTGTVSAGRTRPQIESLIGCFMNFLPIRAALAESDTVREILARVKAAVLNAHSHLECPFEKIVEALNPDRNPASSPIYNVGFMFENFPKTVLQANDLTGSLVSLEPDAALLDLRFIADEHESGITLACEYRKALFEPRTIEELLASFQNVLEILIRQPGTRLADVSLSSGLAEQARKHSLAREKIVIAGTFTAEPLAEPLEFWLKELDLPACVQFAPYNQVFQQLLDPQSLLSRNGEGLNVLLVRMEDWASLAGDGAEASRDFQAKIEQTLADLITALRSAASRNPNKYLLCICPSAKTLARDPSQVEFFKRMQEKAGELKSLRNVEVLAPEVLADANAAADIYDATADELGRVPYTIAYFTALATIIARKFNCHKRPGPKAIVLDCDQTLWAGVCGEDGPEGIQLSPPHRALHEFMRAQLDAGRLLCLCSKNNPEDVEAVFELHTEMPLQRAHFAAVRANWQPKSENLKSLAQELNLGVDSFVLVDDNPIECAEVEANCPGAVALQLPESPEAIPQFLQNCWLLDHQTATAEDKKRTEFYRQERERAQAQADSIGLAEFLEKLDLQVRIEDLAPAQVPRAAQLSHRTNQFNCHRQPRTEVEMHEWLRQGQALAVSASDRFGDYGLVGLLMFEVGSGALNVETFLLSCRALGRGVEHRMLAHLGQLAQKTGAASVNVHFVPSAKNKPALNFLESVGAQFKQALNGGFVFAFPAEIAAGAALKAQSSSGNSLALTPQPRSTPQTLSPAASVRWRWIALEANDINKIQAMIAAKAGVKKNGRAQVAAPRTEPERELCRIWQELLRVDQVGIRDNFFELGGHSLLAVRLFAQIEQRLKVKLPIITIFHSPTIEQLARAVEHHSAQPRKSGLLPIQPKGSRTPLFLVHGAGGDVLWGYANLARHTAPDQPIFGIQASDDEEFPTLEAMAARYVEKVRAFQPNGPYQLGGYCFGGTVAQEMARQLETQGEIVSLLALLDCAPSNCGYETFDWRRPARALDFARNLGYWLEDFVHLQAQERRSLLRRKLKLLPQKFWGRISGKRSREDFDLEEFIDLTHVSERETRLWNHHLRLLVQHVSKPSRGRVTLFRTRGQPLICSFEDDFGWAKIAGNVTVKKIPGSHEGIFMEPHVRGLAKELEVSFRTTNNAPVSKPTDLQHRYETA
jgi:amino acid adenylation domain-containing protein/FkbH-like protein